MPFSGLQSPFFLLFFSLLPSLFFSSSPFPLATSSLYPLPLFSIPIHCLPPINNPYPHLNSLLSWRWRRDVPPKCWQPPRRVQVSHVEDHNWYILHCGNLKFLHIFFASCHVVHLVKGCKLSLLHISKEISQRIVETVVYWISLVWNNLLEKLHSSLCQMYFIHSKLI
jgi:hypothetical protein